MQRIGALLLVAAASTALSLPTSALAQQADMSFFVTSVGKGNGADLGGIDGADAHCQALAAAVGASSPNWRAYLSTTAPGVGWSLEQLIAAQRADAAKYAQLVGAPGINARDRIGAGPWKNAKGVVVATSLDDLHSASVNINKQTALNEKGEVVSGGGDPINMHDIMTGSDPQGNYSTASGDTTCGNWTKSGEGSAILGHHDRVGLTTSRHMNSWNSSHGSRGCSQAALKSTGGAGLFYCFRSN
jgi:hypothetical protein